VQAALDRGLALEFVSELQFVRVEQPAGYCESEITRCVRERLPGERTADARAAQPADQVNLIVYLVESLMEPRDLGVDFSSDPIPSLRSAMGAHASGYAVVPGTFGRSANSEFEILTGMAMHFLPEGCCPFTQYVKRDLPSLPRFLKRHGYRTAAICTDIPSFYSRIQVYKHLGFDDVRWLTEESDVPQDPRRRGPSDDAVVDTIISLSNDANPFFVFAFPNSTHSPYEEEVYLRSDLDVTTSLSPPAHRELKTYINTLRTADRAIGRLFAHFARSKQKTIIVVAGDHQPPLAHRDALPSLAGFDPAHPRETEWHRRRVPLVVWTNWAETNEDLLCSLNFLPTFLLSRMEIAPQGFLAMNESVRTQLDVLSRHIQSRHGRDFPADEFAAGYSRVVLDYQLLQYDLLLGNAYAGEWLMEQD
jgi:phosphoglycerol transferase MdoB-like AlkP superfamily enzyme